MELLHRQLGRFALFVTEGETEALQLLAQAFQRMYDTPPELVGFNEDGSLLSKDLSSAEAGDAEEYEDTTIYLSSFEGGNQMLALELYNDLSDLAEPLHEDNIMLAWHLERLCQGAS